MTLTQLKAKADIVLTAFWTVLKTKQDAYFAKHGKYFQLLISPTGIVVDGVDTNFDVRYPSDVMFVDDVSFSFTSKVPFQIHVDEWVGPQGKGYSATVWAQLPTGDIYTRSRNSDSIDSGWYKYEPKL